MPSVPGPLRSAGIEAVDDPDGPLRIVRLRGRTSWSTLDALVDTVDELTPGHQLHLDVADADIVDASTMRRLEWILDRLECRAVAVKLVGIDPTHPALLL